MAHEGITNIEHWCWTLAIGIMLHDIYIEHSHVPYNMQWKWSLKPLRNAESKAFLLFLFFIPTFFSPLDEETSTYPMSTWLPFRWVFFTFYNVYIINYTLIVISSYRVPLPFWNILSLLLHESLFLLTFYFWCQ